MFGRSRRRIVILALVGVIVLGSGVFYAATALAGGAPAATSAWQSVAATTGASQATTVTTQAPTGTNQGPTDAQLRATILDMIKDHMGLTGAQAERLADQMLQRMKSVGGTANLQNMLAWCSRYLDGLQNGTSGTGPNGAGRGMMGRTGGWGCGGWSSGPST